MDRDGSGVTLAATNGLDRHQIGVARLPLGTGITGIAAKERTPIVVADVNFIRCGTQGTSRVEFVCTAVFIFFHLRFAHSHHAIRDFRSTVAWRFLHPRFGFRKARGAGYAYAGRARTNHSRTKCSVENKASGIMAARCRLVGAGAAGVAAAASYGAYVTWARGGLIAPGVFAQGEDLSGLTPEQARQRLNARFGRLFVTVQAPERAYKLALHQLGGQPQINSAVKNAYWYGRSGSVARNIWRVVGRSVPGFRQDTPQNAQRLTLPVRWDKAQMRRTMWTVAAAYNQLPRDAALEVTDDGVEVIAGQPAVRLTSAKR
jgi:hypothetical protein